jgi:hypothetical protein
MDQVHRAKTFLRTYHSSGALRNSEMSPVLEEENGTPDTVQMNEQPILVGTGSHDSRSEPRAASPPFDTTFQEGGHGDAETTST